MAINKYLSLDRLVEYDSLIKQEIANSVSDKANSNHNHDNAYDTKGSANSALASAKTYADSAANKVKSDLLNGAGTAYDTLKELGDLIDTNVDAIDALEIVASGKANAEHDHVIADVANLQSTLDGKAAKSHGTHVSYSTTTPVMDGTASAGSASTVARSDHRHPTDTSRAAQTSLDSHTSNTTNHITSTERNNWNAAYTHSQSAHAPSDAEANQNAFSNVKVGDVTITADIKTDTLTLVAGSNITLTPDATNDKITISAKDTTYSLGSFGVTATASELNKLDGVTATATEINYVDGVTSNIQTQLDNKAAKSHTHTVANISDLTATATELNYMDGVTSGVQAQLDGKAASSHNHGLLHSNFTKQLDNTTTDSGWSMINDTYNGFILKSLRTQQNAPSWAQGNYAAGIAFGGADTKGLITQAYNSPSITFAGGNADKPVWWIKTTGTSGTTYDFNNMPKAQRLNTNAGDSNTPVYFSNGVPVACTSLDLNTTGSAAKLTTARTIGLENDLTGSATFDGSGNVTISAKHYNVAVNSGNKSNYPYHRFAYRGSKASPVVSQYNDTDAIFLIREIYNAGGYGILKVSLRTNSSTSVSQASATWLARYNFSLDDVKIGLYNVFGSTYADIFIKTGTYARTTVIQLEGNRSWTLVPSNEVNDTTTTDAKTSTECYATIESAATSLHGQAYSSIISSVDGGVVAEASKIGSSTIGSSTQPIYLNKGVATACTYTLGKSVPSNAVFTDTNTKVTNTLATTTKAYVTGTTSASTNTGTQVFDTDVYLDTTAGKLTATTFNGTTFSGSGVATLSEVKTYLGI